MARVRFVSPDRPCCVASFHLPSSPPRRHQVSVPAIKAPRIVVVEDEPAIRRGVADALRASGYEVAEAADGLKGLVEASRPDADLILLDLMLPRMDGLELLRELREVRPAVPVIVLT